MIRIGPTRTSCHELANRSVVTRMTLHVRSSRRIGGNRSKAAATSISECIAVVRVLTVIATDHAIPIHRHAGRPVVLAFAAQPWAAMKVQSTWNAGNAATPWEFRCSNARRRPSGLSGTNERTVLGYDRHDDPAEGHEGGRDQASDGEVAEIAPGGEQERSHRHEEIRAGIDRLGPRQHRPAAFERQG
jgi:hypothetical protein